MPAEWRNQVAVVTGGARGIGRATARLLALSTCSVDSINFARRNQISSCVLSDVTSHEGSARALSPKPTNRNVWTHRHGPRTTCR